MAFPAQPPADRETASPFLTASLVDWGERSGTGEPVVGVLPGEGAGPEVVDAACVVLDRIRETTGRTMSVRFGGKIGLPAVAETGAALSGEVVEFCEAVFAHGGAILCGPGGGRFVYDLRARFDLYCKFTPVSHIAAIDDASILRPEKLDGVDLIVVRENTGGLYFGDWELRQGAEREAVQRCCYKESEVRRILRPALDLARRRRGRLALAVKPAGIPALSELWCDCLDQLAPETGVTCQVLEIDNAAYQLIANPREFDVVVAPNLFGDILSDAASLLLGSRGMSYSGNFGPGHRAVYQTGHGAARDLAGRDRANPVGQIYALAMLLRESFGWTHEATAVESAIAFVLGQGWRTPDIAGPASRVIGTRELGERIAAATADRLCAER